MDLWQLIEWNSFFPLRWHIVKDIPNTLSHHIFLQDNNSRPIAYKKGRSAGTFLNNLVFTHFMICRYGHRLRYNLHIPLEVWF